MDVLFCCFLPDTPPQICPESQPSRVSVKACRICGIVPLRGLPIEPRKGRLFLKEPDKVQVGDVELNFLHQPPL